MMKKIYEFTQSKTSRFPDYFWRILYFTKHHQDINDKCGAFWITNDVICYNLSILSQHFKCTQSNLRKTFHSYRFASEKDIIFKTNNLIKSSPQWKFISSVGFRFDSSTTESEAMNIQIPQDLPQEILNLIESFLNKEDIRKLSDVIKLSHIFTRSSLAALENLLEK
jgi:hypothetical protein